jgi:hypothetical protein
MAEFIVSVEDRTMIEAWVHGAIPRRLWRCELDRAGLRQWNEYTVRLDGGAEQVNGGQVAQPFCALSCGWLS